MAKDHLCRFLISTWSGEGGLDARGPRGLEGKLGKDHRVHKKKEQRGTSKGIQENSQLTL